MRATIDLKAVSVLAVIVVRALGMDAQTLATGKQDRAAGGQQTLTGVVSDAMCGSKHMMKGKTDAECLRACVKQGTQYALVVGKEVYTLVGHEADLDRYAAQKVKVTGTVTGSSIAVDSVAPIKGGTGP